MDWEPLHKEFVIFIKDLASFIVLRLTKGGLHFESIKDFIVDILMVRRGANTSLFIHLGILALAFTVLFGGGVLLSTSVVSGSYPGVPANPLEVQSDTTDTNAGVVVSAIAPITIISDKPRDKIVDYEVKDGDTISSVAREYALTEDTIIWENDLSVKVTLKVGQKIKILPVSGVEHKVASGDTVFTVAKKYQANAQAIVDFPFNNIGEEFALTTGDTLMIPDGAPPKAAKPAPTQYLASSQLSGPVSDLGTAQFSWPASGDLAQYFSWYHPAIDISNLSGGPIRAADSGTVTLAGWPDSSGYGSRVLVDHGNGYTTLYAHLSAVYVKAGQQVGKGTVLGAMGSTGRSTGVHLHLEIRKNGAALNPLSLLGK